MNGREERKATIEQQINIILEKAPDLCSDYVAACFGEGQQPRTIRLYLRIILAFMDKIKNECTRESVKKILPMDISKYLNVIRTKTTKDGEVVPTSTSYRATTYSALRSFFEFLKINRIIDENPMDTMKRPRIKDDIPTEHLTIPEMKLVMEATKSGCKKTQKNGIIQL